MCHTHVAGLDLAQLTRLPSKVDSFLRDPFFRESAYQISAIFGTDVPERVAHLSLVLIRPDALILSKGHQAVRTIVDEGFTPILYQPVAINWTTVRELWRNSYSQATVDRMLVHERLFGLIESVAVIFYGAHNTVDWPASVELSLKKGSAKSEERDGSSIRSVLASPSRFLSLLHVSDEPADVIHELGILFSNAERKRLFRLIADRTVMNYSCEDELLAVLRNLEADAARLVTCRQGCSRLGDNALPMGCPAGQIDFSQWKEHMTLERLDEELACIGCVGEAATWVAAVLAGQCIPAYDPTAVPAPIEKFKPLWESARNREKDGL